ncbi:MAG: T9SS type A sorting domain-containing protein, partial [Ferruginibacter sp.]
AGSTLFNGTGPSVETQMNGPTNNQLRLKIGAFNNAAQAVSKLDFVIHYDDKTWDNNNGADYHITFGGSGGGIQNGVSWTPLNPTKNDVITITVGGVSQGGKLHWGVNNWLQANNSYLPAGSFAFNGTGPATQTPMSGPLNNALTLQVGPFNNPAQTVNVLDFVINYNDNTWDNNNGVDYHINISQLVSVIDAATKLVYKIYPNPVENTLAIDLHNVQSDKVTIRLLDLNGKELVSQQYPLMQQLEFQTEISTEQFAKGVYLLQIETNRGVVTQKIVK